MFTGIIEEVGQVKRVVSGSEYGQLAIRASRILVGTKPGDSIAVNGTCLTVTNLAEEGFTADVMAETMRRTNLGRLKNGDSVNLERAMATDGRFGGHIVSGHIDGCGTIAALKKEGNAVWVTIEAAVDIMELIVEKGSITIDGISLTVAQEGSTWFAVSVIPHTGQETTLLQKKAGNYVNLETDIVGKYIKKLMTHERENPEPKPSGLSMELLQKCGY